MFKVKNLHKGFVSAGNEEKTVIRNVSLSIEPRDFITLIGPSGCGKTTLLRILAGLDEKYSGTVELPSLKDPFSPNTRLGKIGYVPQEFSLFPWLTVEDNIRFGLNLKKTPRHEQDVIVDELLELVQLQAFRKYFPRELSGGMKQKVAICRTLAVSPEGGLMLMDEPFSALDAQTRNALQDDLIRIWKKRELSILFVTHNIDEAVYLSKDIYVMGRSPSEIEAHFEVGIPHPRNRTSIEFNAIRGKVLSILHDLSQE